MSKRATKKAAKKALKSAVNKTAKPAAKKAKKTLKAAALPKTVHTIPPHGGAEAFRFQVGSST